MKTIWKLSSAFIAIAIVSPTVSAADKNTGPWDLEALGRPPKVELGERKGLLRPVYYEGEPYQGKPTRVFAWLAMPERKTDGKLPAMVLVHGGGGTAFPQWASLWAERGYVALAMDLAGHGPDGKRLADGGPGQSDKEKFGDHPPREMWTYHAVADVIKGVSLLRSLPEVDLERIGITGISWGGYLTCIVAGLDQRLKVAVPVYGCGHIHENSAWNKTFAGLPEGQRRRWIENWEPSRYIDQATMPVLFVNGTNDFAYPLDSYQKTYRKVKNRTLTVIVGLPHGHPQGWAPREIGLFVDAHLKDGKPLARISSAKRNDSKVDLHFTTSAPIAKAGLHYSTDTGPWQKRKWRTIDLKPADGTVKAKLLAARPMVYFVTLTDERGATVSTEHEVLEK